MQSRLKKILPGQYFDAESGLNYNYFRDYDPKTGRYIEPDPIGLAGGINLYPYTENNPLNKTDRYGLQTAVIGPGGPLIIPLLGSVFDPSSKANKKFTRDNLNLSKKLGDWIETIGVPSEPMPTPDLSNIPERCRIEFEICKKAADQAECGDVKRAANKTWCWMKLLVCLAGAAQ